MNGGMIVKLKFFLASVLVVFSLNVLPTAASGNLPEPGETFYVADFADVISPETETKMVDLGSRLDERSGAQIVIVTVEDLNGRDVADYALEIFNYWGIGDAERNNGLLFLMAIGDRDYAMIPGIGLEDTFTDDYMWDVMLTYAEEDFDAEDYDASAWKLYEHLYGVLSKRYEADNTGNAAASQVNPAASQVNPAVETNRETNEYTDTRSNNGVLQNIFTTFGVLILFIVLAVICILSSLINKLRFGVFYNPYSGRRVRYYGSGGYWGWHMPPRRRRHMMPGPPPPRYGRPRNMGMGGGGFGMPGGPANRGPMNGNQMNGNQMNSQSRGKAGFGSGTPGGGAARGGTSRSSMSSVNNSSASRSSGSTRSSGSSWGSSTSRSSSTTRSSSPSRSGSSSGGSARRSGPSRSSGPSGGGGGSKSSGAGRRK